MTIIILRFYSADASLKLIHPTTLTRNQQGKIETVETMISYCIFCPQIITNITRHYILGHTACVMLDAQGTEAVFV